MGEAGETPWPRGAHTGGAWLSSARVVRCWVKSRNERNPRRVLPSGDAGNPRGTAAVKAEEGGDDVKSSCPLCPGLHTCYNGRYNGLRRREAERIPQSRPQFGSQAAIPCVKPELLVIADQHAAVNAFPGLVHTARHTTRVVCTRSRRPNPQGAEAPKVWRVRGVKS